ncbi:mRNA cap guanine-N7 methyltransferase [Anopheles stephensi]|uniref:mRNA cap guanine-N7 methyltransferase n=1 Tax=Anopheles stephensi TaxID=30069 RepID=UPI001658C0D0|nr:mRNA cap guanine-N7 methyltransferase [Anopheles stephensi]XP_035906660.1 mRNA cap guanine-N7 methyltransferase [Anopheles stephensi]
MPEEDEEMTPGGGGNGADGSNEHQQLAQKHGSRSAADRSSYYSSSGSRDRTDSRYDDDHYHRSGRDRDRDRSHREQRDHRDRNRDRDHRDHHREHGGRYREHYRDRDDYRERRDRRSRSRSKESRSRDRDRHRSQRGDDRDTRDASRSERTTVQDRLSAEIEQELANLRRQHDLKEALKKLNHDAGDDKQKASSHSEADSPDESKPARRRDIPLVPAAHSRHFGKQSTSSFLPTNSSTQPVEYVPEIQTEAERIEFQRKMQEKLQQHLAAEGKLYPPPAKPQRDAPAPVAMTGFANDGSFLEMFKKLQQQQAAATGTGTVVAPMLHPAAATVGIAAPAAAAATTTAAAAAGVTPMMVPVAVPRMPIAAVQKPGTFKIGSSTVPGTAAGVTQIVKPSAIEKEPPPPPLPVFGRRRGGKILKTGLVKKVRPIEESTAETPNDAWTLYLQEVKKYKSASCDADSKTRPLVK